MNLTTILGVLALIVAVVFGGRTVNRKVQKAEVERRERERRVQEESLANAARLAAARVAAAAAAARARVADRPHTSDAAADLANRLNRPGSGAPGVDAGSHGDAAARDGGH